ncbi:unnamed protein product [Merluccius merluccius]
MKPPPRQRILPRRYGDVIHEHKRRRNRICNWSRAEQCQLLTGLGRLNKRPGGGSVDIDYAVLQKMVPERSVPQLQSMVEVLQAKAVSKGAHQLLWQRHAEETDEKGGEKSIELWRDMAAFIAGDLEDPISTAFSQMLVVSSTEPRSLRNAAVKTPTATLTPARRPPHGSSPGARVSPSTPQRLLATPSPQSASPDAGCRATTSGGERSKCTVDYQKIYLYLANAQKESKDCILTPMEGAVVLDLLMALPEELPLLDCRKLRQHMKETYTRLSGPAHSSTPPGTERCEDPMPQTEVHANAEPHGPDSDAAGENHAATDDRGTCAMMATRAPERLDGGGVATEAALCPLNPFMVPLKLLVKRT